MNESNIAINKRKRNVIERMLDSALYQFYGYTDDDKVIAENMEQRTKIIERIYRDRMKKIKETDDIRLVVSAGFNDERKFLERYPTFRLILLILNNYRASNRSPFEFLKRLRAQREWIKRYQGELAHYVLEQLGKTEMEFRGIRGQDEFVALLNLYRFIIENPEEEKAAGYITTPPHRMEIENALNSMRNQKAATRIRGVVSILTGEEVKWLETDLKEVESWKVKESMTMGIPFFDMRAKIFFDGDQWHLGLVKEFNDEKVEEFSKTNPAYLHLANFYAFLGYLREEINALQRDLFGWEGFEKPKKVVEKLVEEFGAVGFAEELEQKIAYHKGQATREWPKDMLRFLGEKLAEFSSIQYIRAKVIYPFIIAMERLFRTRIEELSALKKPEVSELKDALWPVVKNERNIARNILREAARARKRLRKRIERLRLDFELLVNDCCDAMDEFIEAKRRIINEDLAIRIAFRLKNAVLFAKDVKRYTKQSKQLVGSMESNPTDTMRGIALMHQLHRAYEVAEGVRDNIRSIGKLFSRKIIKKKIEELDRYMERCEKEYEKLNIFMEKNLKFLIPVKAQQMEGKTEQKEKGDEHAAATTTTAA